MIPVKRVNQIKRQKESDFAGIADYHVSFYPRQKQIIGEQPSYKWALSNLHPVHGFLWGFYINVKGGGRKYFAQEKIIAIIYFSWASLINIKGDRPRQCLECIKEIYLPRAYVFKLPPLHFDVHHFLVNCEHLEIRRDMLWAKCLEHSGAGVKHFVEQNM